MVLAVSHPFSRYDDGAEAKLAMQEVLIDDNGYFDCNVGVVLPPSVPNPPYPKTLPATKEFRNTSDHDRKAVHRRIILIIQIR